MRVRIVVAAAASVVGLLAATLSSSGVSDGGASAAPQDSLRALGAQINLRIGTAVTPYDLAPGNTAYSTIVADQFSVLTPENAMKWQLVEPKKGVYDWSGADQVVAFAQDHGDLVRGHTLLWENQLPAWLGSQQTGLAPGITPTELRSLLEQHILTEVSRYRGRIWQWDVANEFFANSWNHCTLPDGIWCNDFWVKYLGEGIIADAYRWAHQADPQALLFYNDYSIAGEDGSNAKFTAVYDWLRTMRAEGVPIDGVGDQGHLDTQYGFPGLMTQDLRKYASLGLDVAITEADVRTFVDSATAQVPTDPQAVQTTADYYSRMLQACLAVPSCISFTVWGFDDAESWVPGNFSGEGYADLYDVNLKPKPSYLSLQRDLRRAATEAACRPVTAGEGAAAPAPRCRRAPGRP